MRSRLALTLALAALAGPAAAAPRSTTLLSTGTTWNDAPIHYQCPARPQVTAVKVEIPAGEATAWHTHPVDNYAYVISGTLELELADGTRHTFKAGDAFAEVVGTVHRGKAVGAEPVVLVVWYMGEADKPFTVAAPEKPGEEKGAEKK
jgi:quercetin dioxygenase-like cupin family protein